MRCIYHLSEEQGMNLSKLPKKRKKETQSKGEKTRYSLEDLYKFLQKIGRGGGGGVVKFNRNQISIWKSQNTSQFDSNGFSRFHHAYSNKDMKKEEYPKGRRLENGGIKSENNNKKKKWGRGRDQDAWPFHVRRQKLCSTGKWCHSLDVIKSCEADEEEEEEDPSFSSSS